MHGPTASPGDHGCGGAGLRQRGRLGAAGWYAHQGAGGYGTGASDPMTTALHPRYSRRPALPRALGPGCRGPGGAPDRMRPRVGAPPVQSMRNGIESIAPTFRSLATGARGCQGSDGGDFVRGAGRGRPSSHTAFVPSPSADPERRLSRGPRPGCHAATACCDRRARRLMPTWHHRTVEPVGRCRRGIRGPSRGASPVAP